MNGRRDGLMLDISDLKLSLSTALLPPVYFSLCEIVRERFL